MSANDGLGLLIGFAVIGGIILGELRSRKKQPIEIKSEKHRKKPKVEDDSSEFESDDIDKDVDEMPDDSLIYDMFN